MVVNNPSAESHADKHDSCAKLLAAGDGYGRAMDGVGEVFCRGMNWGKCRGGEILVRLGFAGISIARMSVSPVEATAVAFAAVG